jgi:hypothetical protein
MSNICVSLNSEIFIFHVHPFIEYVIVSCCVVSLWVTKIVR